METSKLNEPIDLIYILSNGRSGSTILDMLLGTSNETWTLGEYLLSKYEWTNGRLPCGCGHEFKDCPFWQNLSKDILNNHQKELTDSILFRDLHGSGKVLRPQFLPSLLSGKPSPSLLEEAKKYGAANYTILKKIKKEALKRKSFDFFIDASKDPYRLLLLQLSGFFNIKVIHLTKPIQGFIYSMSKPKLKTTAILRMSFRWLIENRIMIAIGDKFFDANSFYHVHYKDIIEDPQSTFNAIQSTLGITLTGLDFTNFGEKDSHGIAGNIARFKNAKLKRDIEWQSKLSIPLQKLSSIIAYPLKTKLKYP